MPKATKQNVTAAIRRQQALELRQEGKTFGEIADVLGMTRGGAFKSVQKALVEVIERYRETADEVLALELSRLDLLMDKMMVYLTDDDPDLAGGQFAAVDRILRIMERRAKYLGLDKVQPKTPGDPYEQNPFNGITETERARRIIDLLTEAQGGRAPAIIDGGSSSSDP